MSWLQIIVLYLYQQNEITMTLQDLKDNRDSIIATLTEMVGEDNVKSVMQINQGDRLETKFSDGTVESTIEKISNKE